MIWNNASKSYRYKNAVVYPAEVLLAGNYIPPATPSSGMGSRKSKCFSKDIFVGSSFVCVGAFLGGLIHKDSGNCGAVWHSFHKSLRLLVMHCLQDGLPSMDNDLYMGLMNICLCHQSYAAVMMFILYHSKKWQVQREHLAGCQNI